MFDDVVLLDDRIVAEGKAAGVEDGKARGFKEGEGMGRGKGFQIAAEMGFCKGCCQAWLALNADDPGIAQMLPTLISSRVSPNVTWHTLS